MAASPMHSTNTNAALVSDDMKAALDSAAAQIGMGELKVHDYMSDNACPVE